MEEYPAGMWHRFEAKKNGRHWFFEVSLQGTVVYSRTGLDGTKPNTKRIACNSNAKAEEEYNQLLSSKIKEGYLFKESKF